MATSKFSIRWRNTTFPEDVRLLASYTGYLDANLRLDGLSDYNEFRKPYVCAR